MCHYLQKQLVENPPLNLTVFGSELLTEIADDEAENGGDEQHAAGQLGLISHLAQ